MIFPASDRFILNSDIARSLYQDIASSCPLVDFHTHLPPKVFVENAGFANIAELWVSSDPYKWRAMRIHGVPERLITGDAAPEEKFHAWAHTLPHLIGNPLYDWAQLELKHFFGQNEKLCPNSATTVWQTCNRQLREHGLSPQSILTSSGVEVFVTSDSWLDTLEHHLRAHANGLQPRMLPSLRADDAFAFTSPDYRQWLARVSEATEIELNTFGDFIAILKKLLDAFTRAGCTLSDHGIDSLIYAPCSEAEAESIFASILRNKSITLAEQTQLGSFLLLWLAGEYTERNWTMQLHLGARRQTSTRLASVAGKAGGYAVMRASIDDGALVSLLDAMENNAGLPRTILYSLHATDYDWIASLSGSFVGSGAPGKVQLGPAWWYNDHYDGIERQLRSVSAYGILAHSVGMNTDSRSFLSSVRHDYFRRILCNLLGAWAKSGRLNPESPFIRELIEAVCHRNARSMLINY